MFQIPVRKVARAAVALGGAALLTGCFMVPGKFDATLDIQSDGVFTYSYDGEIRLLGMTQLAKMQGSSSAPREWDPESQKCYGEPREEGDDEPNVATVIETTADLAPPAPPPVREARSQDIERSSADIPPPAAPPPPVVMVPSAPREPRECTAAELAERKERFDRAEERRAERRERDTAQAKAMFGGIDPSDPGAGDQIAQRLERQHGWQSVEHKGDGLFDVEFRITSRIEHDFAFPMIEGMGTAQPFLYVHRRDDGVVKVEAPGFASGKGAAPGGTGSIFTVAMLAGGFPGSRSSRDREILEAMMQAEGTFRITTDGEILANNTDEGYQDAGSDRALTWQVGNRDAAAPMALIRLSR